MLRDLLTSPESDVVERKREADIVTLAKVISAFANTNGGWLLLGVGDDGALAGWHPNGRAHPRDWLRDVLDNALDPLPHFEAELFEVDGTTIGIVRVPRSSAAPHYIDATGEVFERRNGQTKRARSSEVRQMTLRGSEGTDVAFARLDDRKIALDLTIALDAPRESTSMHARALASIVRVSLVETSDGFRDWVHSAEAFARSHTFVWSAARAMNDCDWCAPPQPAPARTTAGGHTAAAERDGRMLREIHVAWERVGLGGVRFSGERPDDSGMFYLLSNEVQDRWLVTGIEYIFDALDEAGAYGPAVLRWDLFGIRGADVTTVRDRNVVAAQGVIPPHYNNMIEIDTQVDIGAIREPAAFHIKRSKGNPLADDLGQSCDRGRIPARPALTLRGTAVADHQPLAVLDPVDERRDVLLDLRIERRGNHPARALARDVIECDRVSLSSPTGACEHPGWRAFLSASRRSVLINREGTPPSFSSPSTTSAGAPYAVCDQL